MKVLIACDMEGITGVVNWDQVDPSHPEYARFRRLMTADVNAAIRGAFEAGATDVVVVDGHGSNTNVLIEELDPRARLNTGALPPMAMLQGLEASVHAAMFIGYHARIGARQAILGHTWSSQRVANLWLNGQVIGEIGLNAALCGHFGVPVVMISGDQTACAEAVELLGPIEVAVVKQAHGRLAAECLTPQAAQRRIYEAAARSIRRLCDGLGPRPWHPSLPVQMAVDFAHVEMAERAALLPGVQWAAERRIEFTAEDMLTAYRLFWLAIAVSSK